MKIINLTQNDPFKNFIKLYDENDGIKIEGKFIPKTIGSKKVSSIELKIYFLAGIEEKYYQGNICCKCSKCYETDELFFLEFHFLRKNAPSTVETITIPDDCDFEIKSNTIIHINRFIYDKEEEIKPCEFDYGINDQPERKKGNILVGG